jgi:hypothetical protein
LLLAFFTTVLFPLLWVKDIKPIFYWLIPGWFLQASVMAWQWFAEGASRAGGIALNANAGSAFLLLGAIFLMHDKRLRWLSVPLLVAIPFSGSRWVVLVGAVVFGLIFLSKRVPWRYVAVGAAAALMILVSAQHSELARAYRVNANHAYDVERRANPAETQSLSILIPRGFHDTGIHNLSLRMVDETGLLSALAWVFVGGIALWRTPRYGASWWAMLAICLLSVMYYHVWIGPMGSFWWLLADKRYIIKATNEGD